MPEALNSYECFVIQSGSHVYIWQGTQSTFEQQEWAAKIADFLKVSFIHTTINVKEKKKEFSNQYFMLCYL